MSVRKQTEWIGITVLSLAVITWEVLCFNEGDYLLSLESKSLFVYSAGFLCQSLVHAGGFLEWLSAFFSQFLHIPSVGVLAWILLAFLLYWTVIRSFRLEGSMKLLRLLPPTLSLASIMSLDYQYFIMNSSGYFFQPLVALATLAFTSSARDDFYLIENRMSQATERQDWQAVIDETVRFERRHPDFSDEPTRLMVLYRNLALLKLGNEADMAFTFRDGDRSQSSPTSSPRSSGITNQKRYLSRIH